MRMFDDKIILITGGTGSFGKKYVELILRDFSPRKVIVFSRDELKQFEMQQVYNAPRCAISWATCATGRA
jgi:UDP-N-acetylglucosamine 4,6-dehydratase/5-epimerase